MKVMELVERFVVAVEKIAESMQRDTITGTQHPAERMTATGVLAANEQYFGATVTGVAGLVADAKVVNEAAKTVLDREAIKKELTARGITFKTGAKTDTLQKLLDGANKVGLGKVDEPGNPFAETAAPAAEAGPFDEKPAEGSGSASTSIGGTPTATKEQARDHLVALSGLKGKDEALSVLKTLGKADKMSDVDPTRYGLIVDACKVRGRVINA